MLRKWLLFLYFMIFVTCSLAIELPPIMVESSKLDESSLDSAQTVELLDQNKTDSYQIKDVKDLSSTVANVNVSGLGGRTNRTFTFRGISNYVAYESSIAMYIDDAPVPFSFGYGVLDINNIAKIEILKGPQGTLFGKGAESGVINVYTKPTTKTFQSEASIDLGSYGLQEFYGRVSGPMSDKDLSYAFSATKSSQDGFSKNLQTGNMIDYKDLIGFSAKLRYNPNTPWDISLNYTKSEANDGGSAFKTGTKDNPYEISDKPFDDFANMDNDLLSLVIKYKESDYTFTSATSYAKESVLKQTYASAWGGLLIDLDVDIEEFTQEARLKYSFENTDLLVGAFYSDKTKFDYRENIYSYVFNTNSTNTLQNPDENIALFSEIKYWFNSNYALSAGIRYQETKRSFDRDMNQFFQPTVNAYTSTTWKHLLPTFSFSYYANDNAHTYLKYAKGYRPGGYNYRAPGVNLVPFEPEVTDSFELGYKQKLSSSFSFSGALFYNIIKDQRTVTFDNNLVTEVITAKQAYSYGGELELTYETDDLLLYTTLGMTQAKYKELDTALKDYESNNLVDVPNMTAAIGATYSFNANWFIQPSLHYMGKRYYDIQNTQQEDGYTTVDLNLGYKNLKGLKAFVYVSNLFDEKYVDFSIVTPLQTYYHFGDPRVLGLKVSMSF